MKLTLTTKSRNQSGWSVLWAVLVVFISPFYGINSLNAQPFAKLDSLFGNKGRLNIALTPDWGVADALLVQPDGKVVMAGWVGNPHYIGLLRLLPNGNLDPGFGDKGKLILPLSMVGTGLSKVVLGLARDGKIWVAGAGYRPDVSLDLRKPFDYVSSYDPNDFFVQVDQMGIGMGSANGLHTDILLVRLLPNGKVDDSWAIMACWYIPPDTMNRFRYAN
ncbi:MAG: hypothetical protein IPL65_05715 [Lewinellaceae bacterium]|nr:hypothetical protein [Lewinellaceae bacterium]